MALRNSIGTMIRALQQAQAANLKIGGETMYHKLYPTDSAKYLTVASRVSARIVLTLVEHNQDSRDIYIYPHSSTDYNPMSPFAVY